MQKDRVFKCVPFDPTWGVAGTKLDLKAMYRRPRRSLGEYDEVIHEKGDDGLPKWDLCGPLPLRRHSDWMAKGFEYVTVIAAPGVEGSGWSSVAGSLRARGLEPRDYLQHPNFGTWNPKLYLDSADKIDHERTDSLRAIVEKLGSEAVLEVRRSTDPAFTLPAHLQNIPAGGKANTAVPATSTTVANASGTVGTVAATLVSAAAKRSASAKKAAETRAKKKAEASA